MILIITIVIVVWLINKRYTDHINKINEIEQRLNDYYIQREERLMRGLKQRIRNNQTHRV